MTTGALILMILVKVSITVITAYLFRKVLTTPPRMEPDSYADNDEEEL